MEIITANIQDVPELLELQYKAFEGVANALNWENCPNLMQTLDEAYSEFNNYKTYKILSDNNKIIASVRGDIIENSLHISRLMVLPEYQGKGLGTLLLRNIENDMPHYRAWLNTCKQLKGNVYLYTREGYKPFKHEKINSHLTRVFMGKGEK
ncbi:MAG: GNAT family N-acetyltransferase [Bacteroidales bacterium]|nr:GNAT family N-acetyltransferase [Bacteroidales bacterium]